MDKAKLKQRAILLMVLGIGMAIGGVSVFYIGLKEYHFANEVIELPKGEKGILLP